MDQPIRKFLSPSLPCSPFFSGAPVAAQEGRGHFLGWPLMGRPKSSDCPDHPACGRLGCGSTPPCASGETQDSPRPHALSSSPALERGGITIVRNASPRVPRNDLISSFVFLIVSSSSQATACGLWCTWTAGRLFPPPCACVRARVRQRGSAEHMLPWPPHEAWKATTASTGEEVMSAHRQPNLPLRYTP